MSLVEAQRSTLYSKINTKVMHKKLYRATENSLVSLKDSSVWLKHGNIKPREEAALCSLQDRNVFLGSKEQCPHCRNSAKTVDHLATRCDRLLGSDYTRRHNEVVRCLHLRLCNKYGLKSQRRIRLHSVQEIVANNLVEIRVDTRVKTDIKLQHDRPDILVIDKQRGEAVIVEVGITNQDQLQTVETEKLHKYDMLAGEIGALHKVSVMIIPYVMTWDGVVTKCHSRYLRQLDIPRNIEAYIQSRVLKKTLEIVSMEARRGLVDSPGDCERTEAAIERLIGTGVATDGQTQALDIEE